MRIASNGSKSASEAAAKRQVVVISCLVARCRDFDEQGAGAAGLPALLAPMLDPEQFRRSMVRQNITIFYTIGNLSNIPAERALTSRSADGSACELVDAVQEPARPEKVRPRADVEPADR